MMKFSHSEYDRLVKETVTKIQELSTVKGGEYAGDDDRLANFRRNADRIALNMESVWHTYCVKHFDAIEQYIKDMNSGKTRPRLESLEGRADDIIVYMILFKAMLMERNPKASLPLSRPPMPRVEEELPYNPNKLSHTAAKEMLSKQD